jgi:hypothetical protein
MERAQGQQAVEIGRQRTADGQRDIEPERDQQHGAAAMTVGQRTRHQRAQPGCDKEHADDQLAAIGIGHAQIAGDLPQAGQHGVDGQGLKRHEHGHHGDEFAAAQRRAMPTGLMGQSRDRSRIG